MNLLGRIVRLVNIRIRQINLNNNILDNHKDEKCDAAISNISEPNRIVERPGPLNDFNPKRNL